MQTGPEGSKESGADVDRGRRITGYTPAHRRCRIIDGKLHEREEGRPVILPLRDEGAEHVGDDSIDAFGLGVRFMMLWRPKDHSSAEGSMQNRPELRGKAGVILIRD